MTYPNGRTLNYGYGTSGGIDDASSRIASFVDDDGTTHLADYSYLGQSAIVEITEPEPDLKYTLVGTQGGNDPDTGDIYRGLDRFGRVKDLRWYSASASTDVVRIEHGYDQAGNRLWRQDPVAASYGKAFDELYSYDGLYRLQDMQRGTLNGAHTIINTGTETFAQCWTLDSTGNWQGMKQADTGGSWTLEQARTANPVNEITAITNSVGSAWAQPAYDPAGNMTTIPQPADPTKEYTATYDAWNMLTKLVDPATSNMVQENQYDGRRFRVARKDYAAGVLSEERHFYYTSGWQSIEERLGSSPGTASPECQYVWGLRYIDDCLLRDRDSDSTGTLDERLYAMQDPNWNVIALADENGAVQERYAYSAYGVPEFLTATFGSRTTSSFAWETLYCGYQLDPGGLYCVRNRIYQPSLGVWCQRDPIGYPNGLNSYAYHASISGIDPYGLATLCENRVLRAQLSEDWIPGGVGSTREGRISNRCNVNIYCADSCGKNGAGDELGGLTFVEGGHIHICMRNIDLPNDLPLSEIADYQRRFDALILHEMSHAADLCRDPRFHCPQPDWNKSNPPPRDLKPPPFPDPRLCNNCKADERRAYTAQARYICPDDRAFQRAFVNAGICFSCRHVCPEFQAKPCPQFPDACGG